MHAQRLCLTTWEPISLGKSHFRAAADDDGDGGDCLGPRGNRLGMMIVIP